MKVTKAKAIAGAIVAALAGCTKPVTVETVRRSAPAPPIRVTLGPLVIPHDEQQTGWFACTKEYEFLTAAFNCVRPGCPHTPGCI
jgi:hypothetical protein